MHIIWPPWSPGIPVSPQSPESPVCIWYSQVESPVQPCTAQFCPALTITAQRSPVQPSRIQLPSCLFRNHKVYLCSSQTNCEAYIQEMSKSSRKKRDLIWRHGPQRSSSFFLYCSAFVSHWNILQSRHLSPVQLALVIINIEEWWSNLRTFANLHDTLMVIGRGERDGGIQTTLKHSKRVPALQIQQQWPMMEPSNQYDVCCWCRNESNNQTKSLKCVKEPNW